jgi:hypothetical protein
MRNPSFLFFLNPPGVQQSATPKVRDGAFSKHVGQFRESAISAFIHAGKVLSYVVVTKWGFWISRPAPSATRPSLQTKVPAFKRRRILPSLPRRWQADSQKSGVLIRIRNRNP